MIALEIFMQEYNGDTMGALQMPHGGVPSGSSKANHALIAVMEKNLGSFARENPP